MRIALVASSLRLAGAEKQFVYMTRALWQAGVDVRVYYLGAGDYYQGVLIESGIPFRHIFVPGCPMVMLGRLIKELSAFKPHIVLASQFGDLVFATLGGRLCRALVLGGVRSDGFYELRSTGRRARPLLGLTHGLIANSHRAKDNLISKGVDPRKIAVLPNVIDLSDFDDNAARPLPIAEGVDRIQVAAVGSMQSCKRFDRFVAGLASARRQEPGVFGVIAGEDFGEETALRQQAEALKLFPGHLKFLGKCNYVPALLARCRSLVMCSDYEGFPNVILEAMAARLPVIATPAGDAARIVQHGVTGYVVEKNIDQSIGELIARLAMNSSLASQMGEAGRRLVEQEYSFQKLSGQLLSVFSRFAQAQKRTSLLKLLEERTMFREIPEVPTVVATA